ncbi:MAG: M20/M25/M40 family metallo-hydrolase [Planctomycetota bacterium]|jgi:tripeptide aminopeptidase
MKINEIFETLITIPSPSRKEGAVADWIKSFASNLGFSFEVDDFTDKEEGEHGSICVEVPSNGNGYDIVLCAHIDTVEKGDAPIAFEFEDGEYSSSGETILGADDKTGAACLLALLQELKKNPEIRHGNLKIIFTVCEEIELRGSKAMPDKWLLESEAGFALDHSNPCDIVYSAPGKYTFKVEFQGVGGHASSPERKINAANLAAKVFAKLPTGRLDEFSTCNIGVLNSGTKINIIPEKAYAEYEVRSLVEEKLESHAENTRNIIESTAAAEKIFVEELDEERSASVEINQKKTGSPFMLEVDSLPVVLMKKAIEKSGLEPVLTKGKGGSDANVFNLRGLSSCIIGCGMHGAHSTRERATLSEMETCVENLVNLVSLKKEC